MAGLNYGKRFKRLKADDWYDKDGVLFSKYTGCWVVRINGKSMAKFNTQSEAIKFYNTKLSADTSTSIA
jgi:hypothetical protein